VIDVRKQRDYQQRDRRDLEDQVLAEAARLDPGDESVQARQLRHTAASIREHRSSPRRPT
jgi:hypothetical protein